MKTHNHIRAAGLLLLSLFFNISFADSGGSVIGQVTDPDTKEPIDGATVVFESQGRQIPFLTDAKGYYYASNLTAGLYNVTAAYMGHSYTEPSYKVGNEDVLVLDISLKADIEMGPVVVTTKRDPTYYPLVDPVDPQKEVLRPAEIKHMPITKIGDLTGSRSGVVEQHGEYHVHGAREGGITYYIDGCRVMGSPNIPLCGLDSYRMYSGYIPAKYGDTNGAVVV